MERPTFRYFANPYREGIIEASDATCSCCGVTREWEYVGGCRSLGKAPEPEVICAWCLADGSAARKFQIVFVKTKALQGQGLASDVIAELTCRTPAYASWQEPKWLCHCGDACVFHGDLTRDEAQSPDWDGVAEFFRPWKSVDLKSDWQELARSYVPADPSIFKF